MKTKLCGELQKDPMRQQGSEKAAGIQKSWGDTNGRKQPQVHGMVELQNGLGLDVP